MSLTLNEVRNIKFRMAKRSGYEVLDVDEFVDHVEEGLTQLLEENENLKRQVESLQSGQNGSERNGVGQTGAEQTGAESNGAAQNGAERKQSSDTRPEPVRSEPQPATAAPQAGGRETIVVTTSQEASSAVVRLVQLSTEQSEKLVSEAEEDASRIRDEANRSAHQVTTDARTRAERIESEARVNADRVRSDAQGRADQLDQDTETRRGELFSGLEQQRDQLTGAVSELRQFESQYRQNLAAHLKQQLEAVSGHYGEPEATPALLDGQSTADQSAGGPRAGDRHNGAHQSSGQGEPETDLGRADDPRGRRVGYDSAEANGGSETPRLDALLGDH